jgi:hypothetical protein
VLLSDVKGFIEEDSGGLDVSVDDVGVINADQEKDGDNVAHETIGGDGESGGGGASLSQNSLVGVALLGSKVLL